MTKGMDAMTRHKENIDTDVKDNTFHGNHPILRRKYGPLIRKNHVNETNNVNINNPYNVIRDPVVIG